MIYSPYIFHKLKLNSINHYFIFYSISLFFGYCQIIRSKIFRFIIICIRLFGRSVIMKWDTKKVVERISYFRSKKNLSARKLSIMIGKSEPYIHSLENGGFELSLSALFEICEILEIEPDYFFTNNPETFEQDQKLFKYFASLTSKQKEAILHLYDK